MIPALDKLLVRRHSAMDVWDVKDFPRVGVYCGRLLRVL